MNEKFAASEQCAVVAANFDRGRGLIGRLGAIDLDSDDGRYDDGDHNNDQLALLDRAPHSSDVGPFVTFRITIPITVAIGRPIRIGSDTRVSGAHYEALIRRRDFFQF